MSTTFYSYWRATYLTLFSLFIKNLPKMLIPRTLNPLLASILMIVLAHSLSTELPGFFDVSVFVAIWAKMSPISSVLSSFFYPIYPNSSRILTYKNGSFTPPISYSGWLLCINKFFKILTKLETYFLNLTAYLRSYLQISIMKVTVAIKTY